MAPSALRAPYLRSLSMTDEPATKTGDDLELRWPEEDAVPSDRPTVAPPFDVASYARTSDAGAPPAQDPVEAPTESERPTVAPPFDVAAFAKEAHATATATSFAVSPALELRQRLALGDFAGALATAEAMRAADPASFEATAAISECRAKLSARRVEQLGSLDQVPQVVLRHEQVQGLHIDHRAGFLLSLVDGVSSFDLILDICGMPREDALTILADLVGDGVIASR